MHGRRLFPDYYLLWRRSATRLGDGKSTRQFLSQFKHDPYAIATLRGLLSESRWRIDASRFTGDQVLAEVARLILSGELGVLREDPLRTAGANSVQRSADQEPVPAGSPLGSAAKSDEPESDTFPSNVNAVIQATSLKAAAASGAAFCPH